VNSVKICIPVCAERAEELIRQVQRAEELADVIELRFDCLAPSEIQRVAKELRPSSKTFLFTFRPKEQGGRRELNLDERLKFWDLIFRTCKFPFLVDIEWDARLLLAVDPNKVQRIVSFHDFGGVPDDLDMLWSGISELSKSQDIIKIAVRAEDITDSIQVWKLLEKARGAGRQVIPIAMGEVGKWTRILGPAHGAYLTYAPLDVGKATADGQIAAKELIETFRVRELDANTRLYGIIGDPVSSSYSPYIHNPAFASAGINACFVPLQVKDLDAFVSRMVKRETREVEINFSGFSVTMPHKQAIMRHLDDIDPTAAAIGAVNTVKIEDEKLVGYNTDAHGFVTPLKAYYGDLDRVRVAILGAGGAARASVFALKQENADVTVYVRDRDRAEAFAHDLDVPVNQIGDTSVGDFEIVINCTPVGMRGAREKESLLTADELTNTKFVYDLVTRFDDTPLIIEAKKAGVPAIGGTEMLIAQGAKQFEIWTGRQAPLDLIKESVSARMDQ
jgi:3-dehydroquinate dehydratase/shikimate dehydrogenase